MAEKHSLTKRDVQKTAFFWHMTSHMTYNYQRLQAGCLAWIMGPIFEKLYPNDHDKMVEGLERHMLYFNTEPRWGAVLPGMVVALEEGLANDDSGEMDASIIAEIKTALMGPFAGIGDTLWQGTLTPILLAFGISLGSQGNLLGPVIYTLLMFGIMFPVAYICWMKGYSLGKEGIEKILGGNQLQMLITGASAMGAIVLGALSAQFVTVKCSAIIKLGALKMNVQETVFDQLFQGILPLAVTLFTLYLLKNKKMKATTVMLILVVIGVVLGAVGFLGA